MAQRPRKKWPTTRYNPVNDLTAQIANLIANFVRGTQAFDTELHKIYKDHYTLAYICKRGYEEFLQPWEEQTYFFEALSELPFTFDPSKGVKASTYLVAKTRGKIANLRRKVLIDKSRTANRDYDPNRDSRVCDIDLTDIGTIEDDYGECI
jgi:hypothetical protein